MADLQTGRLVSQTSKAPGEFMALAESFGLQRESTAALAGGGQHIREVCRSVALETGRRVLAVSTAEEALELLELSSVDILLTDLRLPGTSGLELLKKVTVRHPEVAVVMLTQYGTINSAVQATRVGAADYVTKPFCVEELQARLEQVAHAVELKRENRLLREQVARGRDSAG
jgi:DNA-binding NtrC family response regulator